MRKSIFLIFIISIFGFLCINNKPIFAEENIIYYTIYDEQNNIITEREAVNIGDVIIDTNFNEYKIININDSNHYAIAKFIKKIEMPKISKLPARSVVGVNNNKKIAMYSTHNDESYLIGDGVESIYGAGGIHDIANKLKQALTSKGIDTTYDETLHIPHNSYAYSRSKVTANNLLKNNPNAIFDIHRDGASRSFYITSNNGSYYSKVRIVVGQSNANKEANLQFALYLVSVAKELYPWLIADIYYGSGSYNQNLSPKALLFEMGSSTIEKEYVMRTIPYLANVINTTLFATTINESTGDLTINSTSGLTIDEAMDNYPQTNNNFITILIIFLIIISIFGCYIIIKTNKIKPLKKSNN